MLFVMISILVFSAPFIWTLVTAIDYKKGKRDQIAWKLPGILLILLTLGSLLIQIYLFNKYGFPIFQTTLETIISLAIPLIVAGVVLLANLLTTFTVGRQMEKSVHDPKTVNYIALGFAAALLANSLVAAPTGKKIAFAASIDQAMANTENADAEEFSVVLVSSERGCLRYNASCRSAPYSNQFFVKNHSGETKEVQVKIRALSGSNKEMKVIDSRIMTLKPNELRLLETEETSSDSSVWNQYSFETDHRTVSHQHMVRFRDPS
ncbi:hypothetical protein [Edaphobacillus lindanitolerans]|uniref:Uncharacterized protein n=1 Tax=Edaphobacillus lindanitolerans TaxID=550447 RepID=A0A1U7PQG6_9BACI|nr:hypothetical protein [Edaphobacillus lindanitolerans]SIT83790.1 hypothetical protein SAMN05428946_1653 [Edaphobacillus lindanitolerans]